MEEKEWQTNVVNAVEEGTMRDTTSGPTILEDPTRNVSRMGFPSVFLQLMCCKQNNQC